MRHSYQQTLRDKGEKENSYTLVLEKGNANPSIATQPGTPRHDFPQQPGFFASRTNETGWHPPRQPRPANARNPVRTRTQSKNFLSLEPVDASIIRRVLFGKVLVQLV